MAAKASSRYQTCAHNKHFPSAMATFDGRSSVSSDASSTTATSEIAKSERRGSAVKKLVSSLSNRYASSTPSAKLSASSNSSKKELPSKTSAIAKTGPSTAISPSHSDSKDHKMASLVKKFMDSKGKPAVSNTTTLVVPADFIAADLKKASAKAPKLTSLQSKFLQKVSGKSSCSGTPQKKKMLSDSKSARPLALVLKSEQELLEKNRQHEIEIRELQQILASRNAEVETLRSMGLVLKELCSKQQEEIKALKGACSGSPRNPAQLCEVLEKQGVELKKARLVIPSLQEQVTSLTAQLKFLAEGLAEVKADKDAMRAHFDGNESAPKTPVVSQEAEDVKEFCVSDPTTPVSQEDMILQDMNPCLTPYYARTKSEEYEVIGYGLTDEEQLAEALQKLSVGSERKHNVLKENCTNVLGESGFCSPAFRKLRLEKETSTHSSPDENRSAFAPQYSKMPHQKLGWD